MLRKRVLNIKGQKKPERPKAEPSTNIVGPVVEGVTKNISIDDVIERLRETLIRETPALSGDMIDALIYGRPTLRGDELSSIEGPRSNVFLQETQSYPDSNDAASGLAEAFARLGRAAGRVRPSIFDDSKDET